MRAALATHRGSLFLYVATTAANVLAFGYQFVMARLLAPADYAILTALFGYLILESISTQVIQSATAKLAAQYRARGETAALHVFVLRWLRRIAVVAGPPALLVVVLALPLGALLALPPLTVALLGVSLFFNGMLTFTQGLLQGLGRFMWLGALLLLQAAARLAIGTALVLAALGVNGAFIGAASAPIAGVLGSLIALWPLLRAARGAAHPVALAAAETRFFLLAAIVLLAYSALTNMDALLMRGLLSAEDAGAYAGAITMAKIVLFAPIAVGFILLERTANAHARGEDNARMLFLALGFVVVTSGAVTLAYLIAPAFFVGIVVGSQYPATVAIIGPYGIAALANALLTLWIAYFIGRGEMRVGLLLAVAVALQLALMVVLARDAITLARIVLTVGLLTQAAAAASFVLDRRRLATAR
ncbi:MAG: oligosaccharide flippase family protein [Candidatus Limnocylindria bacterium]